MKDRKNSKNYHITYSIRGNLVNSDRVPYKFKWLPMN